MSSHRGADPHRSTHELFAAPGLELAAGALVEVLGEARGQSHDRQRRVDRERARVKRAVAHVQALDLVRLAVGVDDRGGRIVAHPAAALHVGGGQSRPQDLRGAGGFEDLGRELAGGVDAI